MSHPVFDIRGRVALVTGSSRGIGRALARGLLEAGCVVVLNGRDENVLAGGSVHTRAFDVTEPDAVAEGIAQIEEHVGALDILVNNAGVLHRAPFTEFSVEEWRRVLETNLSSAFIVGREVARRMIPRGRGKIVNVCSVLSEVARPGIAPYAASKGGLKMLTKGMCADLGPSGIQVNGLAPGAVRTPMLEAGFARRSDDGEDPLETLAQKTPLAVVAEPQSVAEMVWVLADPRISGYLTGTTIVMDGGALLRLATE